MMLANVDRPTMVVGSVLATVGVGGISGEHIATIVLLAAGVGVIVTALAWLDKRIEAKIQAHAAEEEKVAAARQEALIAKIEAMMAEAQLDSQRSHGPQTRKEHTS